MRYRFGLFCLDGERFALERDGRPIPIEPKPLRLLLHLAARHPAAVGKHELLRALWPSETVTQASLTRAVHAARAALGPEGRAVVETVRGVGYRLGVGALERSGVSTRPMPSATGDPFVGRDAVLEDLRGVLEEVKGGSGRVVLACGEPGIGKTRLLDEVGRAASAAGFEVVHGRVREGPGAPPLWPWLQILGTMVDGRGPQQLAAEIGERASDLVRLVPSIRGVLPRLEEAAALPPLQARFRFSEAVGRFAASAGRSRPLLLLLDDLHAAEPATLGLLVDVAAATLGSSVGLLCSYRDVGEPPNETLDGTVGELLRLPGTKPPLRLVGIDAPAIGNLLAVLQGRAPTPEECDDVLARTNGNPFFVRELARAGGTARSPGIRAVLRQRSARLDKSTLGTLETAAVLGRSFEPAVLALASGQALPALWESLESAEQLGFVEPHPDRADAWRFVHALVAETLYDGIPRARRASLHRACAEALQEQEMAAERRPLADLARHFEAAIPAGASARLAAEYHAEAGAEAMERFSFEPALAHCDAAVALGPSGSDDVSLVWLAGVELLRARVLYALSRWDESRDAAQRGADHAERAEDFELMAEALDHVTRNVLDSSVADPLLDRIEHLLARKDLSDLARSVLLNCRSKTVWWRADSAIDPATMIEGTTEAVRLARQSGTGDWLRRTLISHILFQNGLPDRDDERLAAIEELLGSARAVNDPFSECVAFHARAELWMELGLADRLDAETERIRGVTERLGDANSRAWLENLLAARALCEGRFDEALERGGSPYMRGSGELARIGRRAEVQHLIGNWEDDTKERIVARFPGMSIPRAAFAAALAWQGRHREAIGQIEAVAALGPRQDAHQLFCLAKSSEALGIAGGSDQAPALLERLAPFSGRFVCDIGTLLYGSVDRYLALLETLLGRFDRAESLFESGLDMDVRMRARPFEALGRCDYATMLVGRGAPGDRDRARDEVGRSIGLAADLGMAALAARATALAQRID